MTNPEEFLSLQEDWDSYGALPIFPLAVEMAKKIIKGLPEGNWHCVPTSDGGVQIECHDNGISIEIYVGVPS